MKTLTITGSNTFLEISNDEFTTDSLTIVFPNSTTNVGSWRVFGRASTPVIISRTGASGTFTLNYTGNTNISTDYTTVSNGTATPTNTWYMGNNSVDGGGNSGFLFSYGAVRYWVGGTGTWDATTTTNWAYQSGYAGGAPAPTSADDVYFDSNSDNIANFIVTLATGAVCKYFSIGEFSTLDYTMTLAGNANLDVHGSLLFPTSRVTCTYSGEMRFISSSLGNTITTNGVTLQNISISNSTGGWTLGSSLSGNFIYIVGCALLDTNGYNISATAVNPGSRPSSIRNIYLRNSTISDNGYWSMSFLGANTTIFAGTSNILAGNGFWANDNSTWHNLTIRAYNNTGDIVGTNLTFNNLTFSNISSSATLNAITCANLTLDSAVTGIKRIFLTSPLNVTGNFQSGSSNPVNRWLISSSLVGQSRTITSNNVTIQNSDFRDITAAGNIPWTGTNLGDCGNNQNIIFAVPKTVYWNLAGVQNWSNNAWASTSGGTPNPVNFPLTQDTCIFDNAGAAGTITINANYQLGSLDFSQRTNPITFATGSNTPNLYKDLKLSSAVSVTGTATWTFVSYSSLEITSAGVTLPISVLIFASTAGTVRLLDALSVSRNLTISQGTLDLNEKTLTCAGDVSLVNNSSNPRGISFGTNGFIYLTKASAIFSGYEISNFTATDTGGGLVFVNGGEYYVYGAASVRPNDYFTMPMNVRVAPSTRGFTLQWYPSIVKNLTFDVGYTGRFDPRGGRIIGNLTLANGMTVRDSGDDLRGFALQGINQTVQTNGVEIKNPIVIGPYGIMPMPLNVFPNVTLLDDMIVNPTVSWNTSFLGTGPINLTRGIINLNGKKLTIGPSPTNTGFVASGVDMRGVNFGTNGIIKILGSGSVWNSSTSSYLTITGTGVIDTLSASAKTFAGGNANFQNIILNQGGAGDLTISGNNTFDGISNTYRPATIKFAAGSTTTMNKFMLNGVSGSPVTISSSTPGTRYNLSSASGTIAPYYLNIQDSNATGGATWRAPLNYGNTNNGNNLGWNFSNLDILTDNFNILFKGPITV